MYEFHTLIYALAEPLPPGQAENWQGKTCHPLPSPGETQPPFEVSFDEVLAVIAPWKRMIAELDGSFVWTSTDPTWQVDGLLMEASAGLQYVEMRGRVTCEDFDRFLEVLGWPTQALMFEWVPAGFYVTEADFRHLASQENA